MNFLRIFFVVIFQIFLINVVNGDVESDALKAEIERLKLRVQRNNDNLMHDIRIALVDELEKIKIEQKFTNLTRLVELNFNLLKTSMKEELIHLNSSQNIQFTAISHNLNKLSENVKLLDQKVNNFALKFNNSVESVTTRLDEFKQLTQELSSTINARCFSFSYSGP